MATRTWHHRRRENRTAGQGLEPCYLGTQKRASKPVPISNHSNPKPNHTLFAMAGHSSLALRMRVVSSSIFSRLRRPVCRCMGSGRRGRIGEVLATPESRAARARTQMTISYTLTNLVGWFSKTDVQISAGRHLPCHAFAYQSHANRQRQTRELARPPRQAAA